MSIRALLLGVEKHLRSAAVFDDQPAKAVGAFVGIQPAPGKPPANSGQWYAAVWFGGGRGTDPKPERSDEMLAVNVTLTFRLNYAPRDRQAKEMAKSVSGQQAMYLTADAIREAIHGQWPVLAAANAFIPGTREYLAAEGEDPADATVNGFCEPLVTDSFPQERTAPGEWVGGDGKDVYVMDLRFKDARRIRRIYS